MEETPMHSTVKDVEDHNAFCDCREVEQERNGSYHCVACCWTLPAPTEPTIATSDGIASIRLACPWCRESHNPDIQCRNQPTTASEAFTALLANHLVLMNKLTALLREAL
jgi:hypothetical protein